MEWNELNVDEQIDLISNWEKRGYNIAGLLDLRSLNSFQELHFCNSTHFDFITKSGIIFKNLFFNHNLNYLLCQARELPQRVMIQIFKSKW